MGRAVHRYDMPLAYRLYMVGDAMKCPKCGSEMQEEGEFVSDEDEDTGASWEGNGVWGCPGCGHEEKVKP
jgi:hypothetical protein